MNSGLPEFFDGGFNAGSSRPDVVKKNICGIRINCKSGVDLIGGFCLDQAIFSASADLDSVSIAKEEFLNGIVAELREVLSNEISVI